MINSVGMNSTMPMMGSSGPQQKPPSSGNTVFDVADTNMDGLVSSDELAALASEIEETTGNSIDIDEALTTYDADGDGSLSGEELFGLLSNQGFNPGGMMNSEEGGMMPPPPPPPEQAMSAYNQNNGEDTISQLIELLQNSSLNIDEYSSLELSV